MYEIEEILDKKKFVRISQSENINIKRVKNFDFSVTGTIGLELENGDITWVSRRRIKDVRALLAGEKTEVNTGGNATGNAEGNT